MVAKLISDITIKENGLLQINSADDNFQSFLNVYRAENINTPILIWNNEYKDIFKGILEKEIEKLETDYSPWEENPFKDFAYLKHDSDLKVNGIYIKQLNKDNDFWIKNPAKFLEALLNKVVEVKDNEQNSFDLLIALRNTIASHYITTVNDKVKEGLLDLVPIFIRDNPDNEEVTSKETQISMLIFESIGHAIKKNDNISDFSSVHKLWESLPGIIYHNEKERVCVESILHCIQFITNNPLWSIEDQLWNTGLLGILLRHALYTKKSKTQYQIIAFLLLNTDKRIVKYGRKLIDKFLPLDFRHIIESSEPKSNPDDSPK